MLLALAACQSTTRPVVPAGEAAYSAIAVPAPEASADHVIAPGDRIDVTVFREQDFSKENLLVDNSGNVTLPSIGQVRVAGMTQAQVAGIVAGQLGARYLRNPEVTVSLREMAMPMVSVEGEVKQPGVYEIPPGSTLLTAMALARSPTPTAKLDEIIVFRKIDGRNAGARFDLADIRAGAVPDPVIRNGDVIVVGYSQIRGVYQDILKAAPLFNVFTQF
ncbi:MAG TPA: polysaccharide biosynthesis/export family protein [Croceicoccus sp.]|nr:polysaccharide biosynthesis/export family protein [Croceicoccus sp.]